MLLLRKFETISFSLSFDFIFNCTLPLVFSGHETLPDLKVWDPAKCWQRKFNSFDEGNEPSKCFNTQPTESPKLMTVPYNATMTVFISKGSPSQAGSPETNGSIIKILGMK